MSNTTLSIRDCQAMHNFSLEGISNETLAEHYGCAIEQVIDIVSHRPWLLARNNITDLGQSVKGKTWWESDHSDPLELVRLYYPHMVKDAEIHASEAQQSVVLDASAYLEKRFGLEYISSANITKVDEMVENIVAHFKEAKVEEVSTDLVKRMLDQMLE